MSTVQNMAERRLDNQRLATVESCYPTCGLKTARYFQNLVINEAVKEESSSENCSFKGPNCCQRNGMQIPGSSMEELM